MADEKRLSSFTPEYKAAQRSMNYELSHQVENLKSNLTVYKMHSQILEGRNDDLHIQVKEYINFNTELSRKLVYVNHSNLWQRIKYLFTGRMGSLL